ncbi:V-ATPase V1 sector subunit E [Blyttiomyces sp. JEL0837]|nr:V-ATPase V1 sector subunit E [Blyttiomyces sp. JEL0837]
MAGRLSDNEVAAEMNKMVRSDNEEKMGKLVESSLAQCDKFQNRGGDDSASSNMSVAFIKQEALEKAREIKVKADEEFNIEKAKLVRQETIAIEAFYQKKLKQAEVARKMGRLPSISADTGKYSELLTKLILQTFYQLMEAKVEIQCRKQDEALVEKAMAAAKTAYVAAAKRDINVSIDKANPLPDASAGGVIVSANDGRVRVNNTLENRLELLSDAMLPDIRIMLFGLSPSRAFYS